MHLAVRKTPGCFIETNIEIKILLTENISNN